MKFKFVKGEWTPITVKELMDGILDFGKLLFVSWNKDEMYAFSIGISDLKIIEVTEECFSIEYYLEEEIGKRPHFDFYASLNSVLHKYSDTSDIMDWTNDYWSIGLYKRER
jgi:hypothetical protein